MIIDLSIPFNAYLFGLLQTDGSMRRMERNRGYIEIELRKRDEQILHDIHARLPVKAHISHRARNTNFKKEYESVSLRIHDFEFRTALNNLGLPYGRKSAIISTPSVSFSQHDYWRGVIDGDGSLGIDSKDRAFISLVTTSPALAVQFMQYLESITGRRKTSTPNKRDGAYNIVVFNEGAQEIANQLYYSDCLCIQRKQEKALAVQRWMRPTDIPKRNGIMQRWTKEEDDFILSNSIEQAIKQLSRTRSSIYMRASRLKGKTWS